MRDVAVPLFWLIEAELTKESASIVSWTADAAAGQLSATFTLAVIGDRTRESNETVVVQIAGLSGGGATGVNNTGTLTITDDDNRLVTSSATRHLIDRRRLALMRPDAILVNTARGALVDEEALTEALASGRLRAAALDVFEHEPPERVRLLELPNVILTPHIGGVSERSVAEMTRRASDAVVDVLAGRVPANVMNPEALAR